MGICLKRRLGTVQYYHFPYRIIFIIIIMFIVSLSLLSFFVHQIKKFIIYLCVIKTEIKKIKNFVAKTSISKNYFYKIHSIDYPLVAINKITTISI